MTLFLMFDFIACAALGYALGVLHADLIGEKTSRKTRLIKKLNRAIRANPKTSLEN